MRFSMQGDLNQMGIQRSVLSKCGVPVNTSEGIPYMFESEEVFVKAMQIMWDNSVEGWWNYREYLINANICTKQGYKDKLNGEQ